MSKKLTTKTFIEKARKIHGNKYDYSLVNYINYSTKVNIICSKHGVFKQAPGNHLYGKGCSLCKGGVKYTTKTFIEKARKIHGNKYDYSKVTYKNAYTKVVILCPEHGEFLQIPKVHLRGSNCPLCVGNKRKTTEWFIKKATEIHSTKYNYSKVVYKNMHSKIKIICPEHGEFLQSPAAHLVGQGCPLCIKNRTLNTTSFIKKATEIHGAKYDYSKVVYKNSKTKIIIICPEHGEFLQSPDMHLQGQGCVICSNNKKKLTTEDFIERAIQKHCWKYSYTKVNYFNRRTKVTIICKDHGEFKQLPLMHLIGQGCPKCKNVSVSKLEKELVEFIKYNYSGKILENDRTILNGKEVDIYLPDLKIALEFNGLYWHTEEYISKYYHKEKTELALTKGVRLIHLWEDDWVYHNNRTKSWLLSILNLNYTIKLYARQTTYLEVNKKLAYSLFNNYHIQGSVNCTICVGLKYDDKIIAVCGFTKINNDTYNLVRYVVLPGYNVLAGFKKIISNFQKYFKCAIVTFADLSWVSPVNNVYERNGFERVKVLDIDYKYVYKGTRKHKFGFRHKQLKNKLLEYDPTLSEHQNCLNNDIYRIYDCGKIKYKLYRQDSY
jgi:RimJ/RimL family protein N-acetyltransferase